MCHANPANKGFSFSGVSWLGSFQVAKGQPGLVAIGCPRDPDGDGVFPTWEAAFGFPAKQVADTVAPGPCQSRDKVIECAKAWQTSKVKNAGACELLEGKREVSVLYTDWSVSARVQHVSEQVHVTLMAAVRGYVAASGAIPALPAEACLCQDDPELQQGLVSEELLREAEAVRNQAVTLLSAESCSSGEQVKEWVVHATSQCFSF